MLQLFKDSTYDFIGRRRWAYLASGVFIVLSLASLAWQGGLRYGIDFTGGTLIQLRFEQPASVDRIRQALDHQDLGGAIIQEFGEPREFLLRLPAGTATSEEATARILDTLGAAPALSPATVRRVEFVGPQVGRDLQWQAVYAVAWSVVGILLYIALRFDLKGGVAATAAIVHDVLVCLGALSLTGRELSLPVLAALLTMVGYSVNDTIVAYDRLRENASGPRGRTGDFGARMNAAINQTLSRTVLTALTTFFAASVLFLFGGQGLEDFAFTLTVGVVTGTYSTVYIAGALIVDWTRWREAPAPPVGPGRGPRRAARRPATGA